MYYFAPYKYLLVSYC